MKDDLKESLNSRLSSPIAGTFLLSLGLLYWEIFVVAFGGWDAQKKLEVIASILKEEASWNILWAFLLSGIYLFVIPIAELKYYEFFRSKRDVAILVSKKRAEERSLFAGQEFRFALTDLARFENSLKSNHINLKSTLETLRKIQEFRNQSHNLIADFNYRGINIEDELKKLGLVVSDIEDLQKSMDRLFKEALFDK